MKNVLRCALFLPLMAFAAQNQARAQAAPQAHTYADPGLDPANVQFSTDYLEQALGLSAEQAEKLRSIENDCNAQLRAAEHAPVEERTKQEAALNARRNKATASVLTQEQRTKLEQLRGDALKERLEKVRQMERATPAK